MKKTSLLILLSGLLNVAFAQEVKVMTYNIHHGANAAEVDQLDEMAKFIKSSGAELIGLQEVDSVCKRSGNVDQMKRLGELTGMYFAFARHMAYDGGAYGQGILSKYPISGMRNNRITLLKKDGAKDSRALISVEVAMPNKRKLTFASVHFALDAPSRNIQSAETINYLQTDKMPVILTGDLNAEPNQKEIVNLDQYFVNTDPNHLFTFPESKAIKTIDYIFVSKRSLKKVLNYQVFPENKLSDHLPAMASVTLKFK
jgi:endonuclease/exonuclease/phosphatase family metal-dependent hydrolase